MTTLLERHEAESLAHETVELLESFPDEAVLSCAKGLISVRELAQYSAKAVFFLPGIWVHQGEDGFEVSVDHARGRIRAEGRVR